MRSKLHYMILLLALMPQEARSVETMCAEDVTVQFPKGCEAQAGRILDCAQKARATFLPLFHRPGAQGRAPLQIYWRTKEEWLKIGPKGKYGMPHALGKDTVVLPAVNIDPADALTEIILPLTQPAKLAPADLDEFMSNTPKGKFQDVKLFQEYLGSKEFYTDFLIDFVLPHEIMHVLCNTVGILRKPVWPYEGIAQWSSDHFLRKQGRAAERTFYFLLYKMFYVVGKEDKKNRSLNESGNYAWFHGALLTMFREIEGKAGEGFVPKLIGLAETTVPGMKEVTDADWLDLFNQAGSGDIGQWLR